MSQATTQKANSQDTDFSDNSSSQVQPGRITESPLTSSPDFPAWFMSNSVVVPPSHRRRTLILCFDGTGDKFDTRNSNVVQFVSMLKRNDRSQQMIYYQAGLGTYTSHGDSSFFNILAGGISKVMDESVAWNLASHIKAGYRFLMDNYQASDAICIFGFSRGAYTARSLAGMLTKVGLLPPGNEEQIQFAYNLYVQEDEAGWMQSSLFKETFSVDVNIEFLGVWDTVNSVGLLPQRLPFTVSNSSIRYFRHAVSLDERRAKFKAILWPTDKKETAFTNILSTKPCRNREHKEENLKELEESFSDTTRSTDVYEVWFAGYHCDVGGGAVPNGTRHSLARISLRWMIRQCFLTNTGIMFQADRLRTIGLDPQTLYPHVRPRPEGIAFHKLDRTRVASDVSEFSTSTDCGCVLTEEEEDLADALSPLHDKLSIAKAWWILELLPMQQEVQCKDGEWKWKVRPNLGEGRCFPDEQDPINIHRTVKVRMEADLGGKKYDPRTSSLKSEHVWVD